MVFKRSNVKGCGIMWIKFDLAPHKITTTLVEQKWRINCEKERKVDNTSE